MPDTLSETSRRAIITGAGRGLGRAMALGLLATGHRVLAVDRNAEDVAETAALGAAAGAGGRAFAMTADLTVRGFAAAILAEADTTLGGVDILVNNAGLGPNLVAADFLENPPDFDDLDEELVRLFFEVNSIAPFLLSIAAARRMRRQGWGRIVCVTTSHDSMMRRGFAPYGGSKAALEAHAAIMARDLAGTGVTVNVLLPGGAANTAMVPQEAGFDRATLIQPEVLVPPLLWLVGEGDAPTGKRVISATWTPEAIGDDTHPALAPAGWPSSSAAIFPGASR